MGKFTRLAQYFSSAEKSYTGNDSFWVCDGHLRCGWRSGWRADESFADAGTDSRAAASRFHGEMEQMPPPFSAKKIAGTPAYKLARAGKPVELKTAKITFRHLRLQRLSDDEATFAMSISAGGYVRSVAHELGQDLGCGAHLSSLRRTQAGVFTLADAHTLEELETACRRLRLGWRRCAFIREVCLTEMPSVTGDDFTLGRLRNGAQANLPEFSQAPLVKVFAGQRDLVGIAKRVAGTLFQPVVVMG